MRKEELQEKEKTLAEEKARRDLLKKSEEQSVKFVDVAEVDAPKSSPSTAHPKAAA